MLVNDFIASRICISIGPDDPISDVEIADEIIANVFGAYVALGGKTIPAFIQHRRSMQPASNIKICYNFFGDERMGWSDDVDWYPSHGISIVPLEDFISESGLRDIYSRDFDDVLAM